jgi:DNA-binding transcriptional ArsR family regulator
MKIFILIAKCNCDETVELTSKATKREILIEKDKLYKSNNYSKNQLKVKTIEIEEDNRHSYKIVCKLNESSKVSELTISHDLRKCLEGNKIESDYFIVRKSKEDISFYLNAINEFNCLNKVMNYINSQRYDNNRK